MKRSRVFRKAMWNLAFDWKEYYETPKFLVICGAVYEAVDHDEYEAEPLIDWLFDSGLGKRTVFYGDSYWLPVSKPKSYTARIMLPELGALMSEEEGQ